MQEGKIEKVQSQAMLNEFIGRYWGQSHQANKVGRPVAWSTAVGPIDVLNAMGFFIADALTNPRHNHRAAGRTATLNLRLEISFTRGKQRMGSRHGLRLWGSGACDKMFGFRHRRETN